MLVSLQDSIKAITLGVEDVTIESEAVRGCSCIIKANSELARWNNEGDNFDATIATNFGKTKRFAMIKAEKDSMIYPNDGEWWGSFDSDGKTRLAMKDTDWYKKDLFGLKTADEAGKIFFEETAGDHLQFTKEELYGWVEKYFPTSAIEV